MLKIINDGLTRSRTGCFIAVPIWQQWASKVCGCFAGDSDVLIVSYPRYCRYRAALSRLIQSSSSLDALSPRLLAAVGLTADLPFCSAASTVRVLFCRSTVAHPALHKHAFRLDDLGTRLLLVMLGSSLVSCHGLERVITLQVKCRFFCGALSQHL